ncbi:MAG: hypothetical protein EBX74_04880, partial [Candidatus Fonsibacter lacus]|nr:hypothetical protein [Candidatus Fonsibacter lacus]
ELQRRDGASRELPLVHEEVEGQAPIRDSSPVLSQPEGSSGVARPPFESAAEMRRDIGAALLKRRVAERVAAQEQKNEQEKSPDLDLFRNHLWYSFSCQNVSK